MKNEMIIRTKRDIKAEKQDKAKDFVMSIIDEIIFWMSYGLMFLGLINLVTYILDRFKVMELIDNSDILSFVVFVAMLMVSFVLTKIVLFKIHRTIIKHVKID